jgi:hypothetical protein
MRVKVISMDPYPAGTIVDLSGRQAREAVAKGQATLTQELTTTMLQPDGLSGQLTGRRLVQGDPRVYGSIGTGRIPRPTVQ